MSPGTHAGPVYRDLAADHHDGLDRRAGEVGDAVDDDDRVRVSGDMGRPVGDQDQVGLLPRGQGDVALRRDEDPAAVRHVLGGDGERRQQEQADDEAQEHGQRAVDGVTSAGSHGTPPVGARRPPAAPGMAPFVRQIVRPGFNATVPVDLTSAAKGPEARLRVRSGRGRIGRRPAQDEHGPEREQVDRHARRPAMDGRRGSASPAIPPRR